MKRIIVIACMLVLLAPMPALAADLVIGAPEIVLVGESFVMTVTAEGSPVEAATVICSLGGAQFFPAPTNASGITVFTPTTTGELLIIAMKSPHTDGNKTIMVSAAAPALTWQTEPPTSVEQGDDVTFDVSFSEPADYYFRVENSTGSVIRRYPTSGTNNATNPTARTWTTTTATPAGDYTIIINIDGADNPDTRTVTVVESGTTPTLASITISPPSCTPDVGGTQIFTPVCTDTDGNVMTCPTLTWTSSNTTVGTITSAGVFTALAAGTTTITASAEGIMSNDATVTMSSEIVKINSWTLPATGNRGTAIDATVNITNTGAETAWFVVSVAGTSTTGESIIGLGTVELGTGATKSVYVKIPVPGDPDAAGTYTLYPDIYTFGGYPDVGTLQAIGSGDTIVIS